MLMAVKCWLLQNKAISDKSRWSFRRRSTRHRVLKNSDISEPETLSSSKAKAEIAPSNIYSSTYSYASEKPLQQEKPDEKILQQEKSDEKILQQDEPAEKILQQEKPDEKILQQDKPDEGPLNEEMPDEKLIEKPIDQPGDESIEKPADEPIEKSADQITERSIEQPAERVTEVPIQEPTERVTETPIVKPNDNDVEEHTDKTDESIFVSSTEVKQEETVSLFDGSSEDHQEDCAETAAAVIQSGIRVHTVCCSISHYLYLLIIFLLVLLHYCHLHDYRKSKNYQMIRTLWNCKLWYVGILLGGRLQNHYNACLLLLKCKDLSGFIKHSNMEESFRYSRHSHLDTYGIIVSRQYKLFCCQSVKLGLILFNISLRCYVKSMIFLSFLRQVPSSSNLKAVNLLLAIDLKL